jgi:hypothetical protein
MGTMAIEFYIGGKRDQDYPGYSRVWHLAFEENGVDR